MSMADWILALKGLSCFTIIFGSVIFVLVFVPRYLNGLPFFPTREKAPVQMVYREGIPEPRVRARQRAMAQPTLAPIDRQFIEAREERIERRQRNLGQYYKNYAPTTRNLSPGERERQDYSMLGTEPAVPLQEERRFRNRLANDQRKTKPFPTKERRGPMTVAEMLEQQARKKPIFEYNQTAVPNPPRREAPSNFSWSHECPRSTLTGRTVFTDTPVIRNGVITNSPPIDLSATKLFASFLQNPIQGQPQHQNYHQNQHQHQHQWPIVNPPYNSPPPSCYKQQQIIPPINAQPTSLFHAPRNPPPLVQTMNTGIEIEASEFQRQQACLAYLRINTDQAQAAYRNFERENTIQSYFQFQRILHSGQGLEICQRYQEEQARQAHQTVVGHSVQQTHARCASEAYDQYTNGPRTFQEYDRFHSILANQTPLEYKVYQDELHRWCQYQLQAQQQAQPQWNQIQQHRQGHHQNQYWQWQMQQQQQQQQPQLQHQLQEHQLYHQMLQQPQQPQIQLKQQHQQHFQRQRQQWQQQQVIDSFSPQQFGQQDHQPSNYHGTHNQQQSNGQPILPPNQQPNLPNSPSRQQLQNRQQAQGTTHPASPNQGLNQGSPPGSGSGSSKKRQTMRKKEIKRVNDINSLGSQQQQPQHQQQPQPKPQQLTQQQQQQLVQQVVQNYAQQFDQQLQRLPQEQQQHLVQQVVQRFDQYLDELVERQQLSQRQRRKLAQQLAQQLAEYAQFSKRQQLAQQQQPQLAQQQQPQLAQQQQPQLAQQSGPSPNESNGGQRGLNTVEQALSKMSLNTEPPRQSPFTSPAIRPLPTQERVSYCGGILHAGEYYRYGQQEEMFPRPPPVKDRQKP